MYNGEYTATAVIRCFWFIYIINILGITKGVKVPHSISNPVIRRLDDGKYAIALFVYTFNREQIQSGKANRPLEWLLLNPTNGKLIERVSCSDKDFSDDKSECVELRTSDNTKYSKEYVTATISIFDTIIKKYTEKNEFDKQLNDVYMYMMTKMVPVGLKPFYKDLVV